jgi:hypothetical protein
VNARRSERSVLDLLALEHGDGLMRCKQECKQSGSKEALAPAAWGPLPDAFRLDRAV